MYLFSPPGNGVIDDEYLLKSATGDYADAMPFDIDTGIRMLSASWDQWFHIGDIPDINGEQHQALDPDDFYYVDPDEMDNEFIARHALDEPAVIAIPAMPSRAKPIKARTWLMDSGASVDLKGRALIKPHSSCVRTGDKVILDTANGEYLANKVIDLELG